MRGWNICTHFVCDKIKVIKKKWWLIVYVFLNVLFADDPQLKGAAALMQIASWWVPPLGR